MNSRVRGNLAVRIWVLLILATAFVAPARADQPSAYGPELEGFEYPFTPERFSFPSQGQTVSMTFMDVAPLEPHDHDQAIAGQRIKEEDIESKP